MTPINPFKFVPGFRHDGVYYKKLSKGYRDSSGKRMKYQTLEKLKIKLDKVVPDFVHSSKTFSFITEDGVSYLIVEIGYQWNGSDCSSDWRSHLASLVHDCLCQSVQEGHKHGYYWRQRIYRDILAAQGFPPIWRNLRFLGLLIGNGIY